MLHLLNPPIGNLMLRKSYENGGISVPAMHKIYPGKIATFRQLNLLFTNECISGKCREILRKASPVASSTMHAYTGKNTLRDFADAKGVIYIDGHYDGETTLFGGFTLETLRFMGINVDLPGAFLMANRGYSITGVKYSGTGEPYNYTIDFSGLHSTELKQVLHIVYGEFKNGELRCVTKNLSIPVEKLAEPSNPDALIFNYFKPGPAIPGFYYSQESKRHIFNYDYEFGLNLDEDACRFSPGVFGVITFDGM